MSELTETTLPSSPEKTFLPEALLTPGEELAHFGTWEAYMPDGKMHWSEGMYNIYGYAPANHEPSLETFLSHVHPEDKNAVSSFFYEKNGGEGVNRIAYRIIDKSGTIKYINTLQISCPDVKGGMRKISGFSVDNTQSRSLEIQLNETQANYKTLIKNLLSAFFLTNRKGDILETNDAACEMFGYTNDELIQMSRSDIVDENDPKFLIALERRRKKGRMKGEVCGIKKSGERILLEFTSTQFLNAQNEERNITSVVDITARRQQEEILLKSNERFEQVGKATSDAIWDWDVKSKKLYFGDGFKELFGYQVPGNTGDFSTWHQHIYPEDKERVIIARLNKIIHHNETNWKDEYRYVRADGTIAYITDRGILLRNSAGTYRMIGAMQDITELKEKEIAISDLNRSLEKRAEELAFSNEELERFAYVASHDLQEPLRMVSSFLQLLRKKYDQQLDETAQKYINYAVEGADRMKTLILDLLAYSRVSSDKQDHSLVNLNELMIKTLQVLKPFVDEVQATLILPDLPEIYGNSTQLQRLFQNLISNALKYRSTEKPGVEIGWREKDEELEFFVKDNGIGIPSQYFEKIFIIFQRLHTKAEYGGTGIGLAICKKIVDLHGGKIWVESSVPGGSTFYFTMPKPRK